MKKRMIKFVYFACLQCHFIGGDLIGNKGDLSYFAPSSQLIKLLDNNVDLAYYTTFDFTLSLRERKGLPELFLSLSLSP